MHWKLGEPMAGLGARISNRARNEGLAAAWPPDSMLTVAAPKPAVPVVLPPDEPVAPEDVPVSPALLPADVLLAEVPLLVVPVGALPVHLPAAHSSVAGLHPARARTKTRTPITRMRPQHPTRGEEPASSGSVEFKSSDDPTAARGART
ncbi:MAG: hypothetical protein JST54_20545 [Deltaproteobacteria bacterium]|nr:hypothetical protein [Deltaproteobacteria bacterium]